jgi:hypothetical protein
LGTWRDGARPGTGLRECWGLVHDDE